MTFVIILSLSAATDQAALGLDDDKIARLIKENLKIYPNPVKQGDRIYVQYQFKEDDKIEVRIYNLQGMLAYQYARERVEANQIAITTENLPAGNYLLQLIINDFKRTNQILITN